MPEESKPKDLQTVLARLKNEWRELADLLATQGKSEDSAIGAGKILLRDASGRYRGQISANPDGSADLCLGDDQDTPCGRLGVNLEGEAFLELIDQQGTSSVKAAIGALSPGAETGPTVAPVSAPPLPPHPLGSAEAEAVPPTGSSPVPAPSAPDYAPSASEAILGVPDPLNQSTGQPRLRKFYWALVLLGLGVTLALQAYVLLRPPTPSLTVESLVVRDPNGHIRALLGADGDRVRLDLRDPHGNHRTTLGLGSEGSPYLVFYDRHQQVRAELDLGPDGEPHFILRDQRSLQGKTAPNDFSDSSHQYARGGIVSRTGANRAEGVSPKLNVAVEEEFVGSKTSNKYHYPTCKWVRAISPWNLIKFKSAAEARALHYIPCPVCKPPPLSRPGSPAP
jgi:hypothetical protein